MKVTDKGTQAALDAAGTAADYSARATYQRGYDAGVASVEARANAAEELAELYRRMGSPSQADLAEVARERDRHASKTVKLESRAEAAEAREWALGVQVVAQAQRLKLAEAVCDALKRAEARAAQNLDGFPDYYDAVAALAAWDTVPGMEP